MKLRLLSIVRFTLVAEALLLMACQSSGPGGSGSTASGGASGGTAGAGGTQATGGSAATGGAGLGGATGGAGGGAGGTGGTSATSTTGKGGAGGTASGGAGGTTVASGGAGAGGRGGAGGSGGTVGSGGTTGATGGSAVGGRTGGTGGAGAGGTSTQPGSGGVGSGGQTGTGGTTVTCTDPAPTSSSVTVDAAGVAFTVGSGKMKVYVCRDDIIRVQYTSTSTLPKKDSLSISNKWTTPTPFCATESGGVVTITTARMKAKVNVSSGLVSYTDLADKAIVAETSKSTTAATVEGTSTFKIATAFSSTSDEGLFGLGQRQDGNMNMKGKSSRLYNDNSWIHITVMVSSKGYGLLWDNYSTSNFSSTGTATSFTSDAGEGVDYYFFYGPTLDQVIAGYRTATGGTPLFPKWAYGLFHSKDKYARQTEILAVKDGYRNAKIPIDCIVQDWDYWSPSAWGSHVMDPSRYPDPKAMLDQFHTAHIHGMISIWPVFQDKSNPNFNELSAAGFLLDKGGSSGHQFFDTYDPEAQKMFWRQQNEQLVSKYGWDGIWADNTEPQDYPSGTINRATANTALGKMALVVNAFPIGHAKALYEGWRSTGPKDKRIYVLTRSATAGQQRYGTTMWSGDINCDFPTYTKQIPAGLNFMASGFPYWTTDIGGYWGHEGRIDWTTAASNEMFTRWFQYGAFSPIFRIHGGGARELYGSQWSATTKANLLKIDNLRYRLMPYIYSLAWKVTSEGYTIMRPLVFDYQTDSKVFDIKDQFLFGPALLVNPVTAAGVTSRQVYLPAGTWVDFWTGETKQGGASSSMPAPLDSIPILVKAGSIVPMGPMIQYATESIDPLEIRVYKGQNASFVLYEDEGDTYNYETGKYSEIRFTWDDAAGQLTIGARTGSYTGMPASRTFNVVWVGANHGNGLEVTATPDQVVKYDGSEVSVSAK
jgi:alpha-D-xyloside xylohydrolase